jgi:hypothetical protein
MTQLLRVADINSYLANNGWHQESGSPRGPTLWSLDNEYELIVPTRDNMGDSDLRIRDILQCLSAVEDRSPTDISDEISSPLVDTQWYRSFPEGHPAGFTSLTSGLQAVHGVRDLISAAARAVVDGPHYAFRGKPPRSVAGLLRRVELGPTRPGSFILTVRVPATGPATSAHTEPLPGRGVLFQMLEALSAVAAASERGTLAAFDTTVTAGVSADFCTALSDLAGLQRREPFEISFRWARGLVSTVPAQAIAFPAGAGALIRAASRHLRQLNASGTAIVVGRVESLHDDAPGGDRWRVKVRGELRTELGVNSRRTVWVRLAGQAAYDLAIRAHRDGLNVRVTGALASMNGPIELLEQPDGLEVISDERRNNAPRNGSTNDVG